MVASPVSRRLGQEWATVRGHGYRLAVALQELDKRVLARSLRRGRRRRDLMFRLSVMRIVTALVVSLGSVAAALLVAR
jgi:hypothetical protein